MAEVHIRDLRKSYGAQQVVHGLNIEIADGQFVDLVGPSGGGKSSHVRMIAGLEGGTSGTISIGDRVVKSLPPAERNIAMVFQNYALYPRRTVAANMGFALKMANMAKTEVTTRVNRAAETLGLTPSLARFPRELSGGQRQRVAMARAIVRDPAVFLFDEPLSNLDAKPRVQMRSEIRELHQRLGTTTVYLTHDRIEAMTMADRIVVMRDGHIAQIGAPLELHDSPANTFVAGFIGSPSMNLIEGVARQTAAGMTVDVADISHVVSGNPSVTDGQKVMFGIRPEHLDLSDAGITAKITVIEPAGSETHVVLRAGSQNVVAVFRDRHAFKVGDTVHLAPQPRLVHLFDANSGDRI